LYVNYSLQQVYSLQYRWANPLFYVIIRQVVGVEAIMADSSEGVLAQIWNVVPSKDNF